MAVITHQPAHLFKHGCAFLGILHGDGLDLSLEHEEVLGLHQDSNLLQSCRVLLHSHRLHRRKSVTIYKSYKDQSNLEKDGNAVAISRNSLLV